MRSAFVALFLFGLSIGAHAADNKSYCLASGKVVLFLVDVTTPYDQTDKDSVVRVVDKILGSISGGDRLVIKTISDNYTRSERLIERCIPQCAVGGSVFDRLTKCSDGVLRTDTQLVKLDVIAALKNRLANFQELRSSDILRTIFNSVKEEKLSGQSLSLHIYSDLIESSDYFSTRYLFSYSLNVLMAGVKHYKLLASLDKSEVYVSGVGRGDSKDRRQLTMAQLSKLNEFWSAYFYESGAVAVKIGQNSE